MILRAIDAVLVSNDQRDTQLAKARELAERVSDLPREAVIQTPLRLLAALVAMFFGEHIMSWRAARLYAAFSLLLLPAVFGIAGWVAGVPLGITQAPWQAYAGEVEKMRDFMCVEVGPQVMGNEWICRNVLSPLSHPSAKWIYTLTLAALVIGSVASVGVLAFWVARSLLDALITIERGAVIACILVAVALYTLALGAMVVVPAAFLLAPVLYLPLLLLFFALYNSTVVAIGFMVALVPWAWAAGPWWLRGLAVSGAFPTLSVLGITMAILLVRPLRGVIKSALAWMLARAAGYRPGVLNFVGACLGGVAGALSLIGLGVLFLRS